MGKTNFEANAELVTLDVWSAAAAAMDAAADLEPLDPTEWGDVASAYAPTLPGVFPSFKPPRPRKDPPMTSDQILRRCIFRPYRKGMGPTFTLTMWATDRTDSRGQTRIGYRLRDNYVGVIFEGADFAGSPMHADDSDETVEALMGFLTLKPGDTDADYFDSYTPGQLGFALSHGEALACEVLNRYGTDR